MALLRPVRMGKKAYVLRALQPSEDRAALQHWDGRLARLEAVMASMGTVVAWGHLCAGGRDGPAITDELIEFGVKSRWKRRITQIAELCAEQVRADWLIYARAYDDGYFTKGPGMSDTQ
jgi:hypothetical protein